MFMSLLGSSAKAANTCRFSMAPRPSMDRSDQKRTASVQVKEASFLDLEVLFVEATLFPHFNTNRSASS